VRYYHYLNLLSIDVALGAVVSAAFFGRILHVPILPQGFVLLGIVVWLIYTADHLLDAWSMKEAAISKRHRFHQKHFMAITLSALVAGGIALVLIFMIRVQLITTGIIFGAFVVIYLLINRWLKYFKELAGSLLYTGGVLLPAWSVHVQPLSGMQSLLIGVFTLIVLTNMLIFARFSMKEDEVNQQKSLATILGVRAMNTLITIVIAICSLLIVYTALTGISIDLLVLLVMEACLVVVFGLKYFRENDRYRIYGDAIFLLPIVLFIVPPPPEVIVPFLPSAQ
jgi:hypothetical protein